MECVYAHNAKARYSGVCYKKYNTHEFYAVNENEIYLYSYSISENTMV